MENAGTYVALAVIVLGALFMIWVNNGPPQRRLFCVTPYGPWSADSCTNKRSKEPAKRTQLHVTYLKQIISRVLVSSDVFDPADGLAGLIVGMAAGRPLSRAVFAQVNLTSHCVSVDPSDELEVDAGAFQGLSAAELDPIALDPTLKVAACGFAYVCAEQARPVLIEDEAMLRCHTDETHLDVPLATDVSGCTHCLGFRSRLGRLRQGAMDFRGDDLRFARLELPGHDVDGTVRGVTAVARA